MVYNINGIDIPQELFNSYLDKLINKIFAILGIYENCTEINNYESYSIYLTRVITEVSGGYYVIGGDAFISLTNILTGMKQPSEFNHKQIKSLVFHCISIIKKLKIGDDKV